MFPAVDSTEVVLNAEFGVGLETPIHPADAPMPPLEQQIALLAADRDSALNGENVVMGGTFPTFSPGDKRVGLVPLGTAQKLLRMEGRVTEYAMSVEPQERADEVRDAIAAAIGPDYEVHTWDQLFPFIKTLTGTQDFIFSIVSGVFLTVVLLGIVNAMLMTVLERTREIGTMLAVGMRRRKIINLFLAEGLVIGAVGGAMGLMLGYAVVLWLAHVGIPLPAPGASVPSTIHPLRHRQVHDLGDRRNTHRRRPRHPLAPPGARPTSPCGGIAKRMSRLPRLAARNVGRNRRRSLITGVAIVICVAMVVLLKGFIVGVSDLMVADVVEGRSGALQVHKKGFVDNIESVPTRMNIPYTPELVAKIKAVRGVTGVTGRLMFNGLIGNGLTQTMFVGRGIDVAHEEEACPRSKSTVKEGGAPLVPTDTNAVLIGFELGESFDVKIAKSVNVQTTSPTGRSNSMDLTVRGFSTSSFPFENKRVLTAPLKTAQDLLGLDGRVTEYALRVDDLGRLEQIKADVQTALGPDYEVHTWQELNTFVRDIINRQNIIMGAIAFVLFVIALTVIGNTMLMSVFERVREIGTLLAVGVRRFQVLQLFVLEAAILGLIGGFLGAALGQVALFLISAKGIPMVMPGTSSVAMLRPNTSWAYTGIAVLVAIAGALIASALPARRASRLNPVEALRNG